IHLYNLRKFKQVFFPDIRFLRDLQLATRRQSKVQHWWLLLLRMLFLAALVLAFAQPYINSGVKDNRALVQAIFIDNSYSMTAAKGPLSLLDKSKSVAMDWIRNAPLETRFVVMSHDRTSITRAVTAKEAEEVLQSIQVSAQTIPLSSILNKLKAAEETEQDKRWAYFLFTDLQAPAMVDSLLINNKIVPPK